MYDPKIIKQSRSNPIGYRRQSNNYEETAAAERGTDYPVLDEEDKRTPLSVWYEQNPEDTEAFEKMMRRKMHYIMKPTMAQYC